MKVDFKDLWVRAYKTFVQAFLSSVSLGLPAVLVNTDFSVMKASLLTLLGSAAIAGLSALFSFLGNYVARTA